ncbi:glycine--tRNA ligase subunit beta [Virgibacillus soli]|uniref:Glycine--tRNA ligase beta subunit n=1 Tax=Paracerasibacillus soli TaxID=480284 RepID=A0ABU5CQ38_9BACI|nr:glycine--tRNA ligase subunit beta [Virgibacillus soli]MDY0408466.1 glycine--tRNA ligase subunit beta [Virgibacillus soli]
MSKNVLFEIGLEELPARFIDDAEKQLFNKTKDWLTELRIDFKNLRTYSTPRRLAVYIEGVAEEQTTLQEEVRGPSLKIAKDQDGNWTKAAIGFTKGQGKTTEDIEIKEVQGTEYIFVNKVIEGKRSETLLKSFSDVILSIHFGKNMRWGNESIKYVRPIRWLVALYDKHVIPFEISHVKTSNITYGHRFLGETITLQHPDDYEAELEKNYVIVDRMKREQLILSGIKEVEKIQHVHVRVEKDLLDEVCNLVEFPTAFLGDFDQEYLKLPSEVLITSMKEHQRYFPVYDQDEKLLPHFVGVRNGDSHCIDKVVKGNEKVLRARLADAQFFFEEDKKNNLEYFQEKLTKVVFQEKLGTISDKVARIKVIVQQLSDLLQVTEEEKQHAIRAAEICKFDLMTNMVNEFTELQGVMGEKYARFFKEDAAVAQAISEQYMPSHAKGKLPESVTGTLLSVADKLDTIIGCIYVGLRPSGSQDPYGLRRQAIGVFKMVEKNDWDISLKQLLSIPIHIFLQDQHIQGISKEELINQVTEFMKQRAVFILNEYGIEADVIQAVLAGDLDNFSYMIKKANLLSEKRHEESFKTVHEALERVLNLAAKSENGQVDKQYFETDSERALYDTWKESMESFQRANDEKNAQVALGALDKLANPIHAFFDNNMVMAEDQHIRANRLALLHNIAQLVYQYADFTKVEWKQHF